MRICQVGTGFIPLLPDVTGGTERYIHNLSVALRRAGHEVTVIDIPIEAPVSFPYTRVEVPVTWRHDSNVLSHALRGLLFGAAASRKLEGLIQNSRVDLVNFHSQFVAAMAMPVARRHRVPCVFTMHNPLWSDTAACASFWDRTRFRLEWRAEARAEYVIGLSESVTDNRVRYFGLCRSKAVVVPVGVDDLWFERKSAGPLVQDKYAPNGEAVVLHVGRIAPYKNQLTLVKALARVLASVSHARVVFVGPVDSQPYLRKLWDAAAEMGVARNIVVAGHVSFGELTELYSLASIVVLPSLRENCPQAALEAMAQGKAIVASDIPPIREVFPDGTAILVPALNHEALATAIVSLLGNDRFREEIGARTSARAHRTYRWDSVSRRIVGAYARMLQGEPMASEPDELRPHSPRS